RPDLRQHVGEDEHEQQRLEQDPDEGGHEVLPHHPDLPGHHRGERLRHRGPQPGGGGRRDRLGAHSRYSRPVRLRNAVSRLGGSCAASLTATPAVAAVLTSSPSTPRGSRANTRTWPPVISTLLTPGRARSVPTPAVAAPS